MHEPAPGTYLEIESSPFAGRARTLTQWLLVGLLVGFVVFFFRAEKQQVLASRGAEAVFELAAFQYEAIGPRFGSEDYLAPLQLALNAACDAAQPGQRLEERVGDWLMTKGLFGEAADFYARALTRRPSVALARKAGLAAIRSGRSERVADAYRVWIRLSPKDPEPYNTLGYYYAVEGIRLEEAEGLIEQALSLVPPGDRLSRAAFLDSLAWVYHRQQRRREAWEAIQEVQRLFAEFRVPMDPIIQRHYDEILGEMQRGRTPDATSAESETGRT